jgi:tetratricopeptide (TPR) repeat protein
MSVVACLENLTLPTYPVGIPEKNPVFFEKRVYQGSCGKVYPVPFIDKVYDDAQPVTYRSVRLENEYVRLVLLPEIGGRIFIGQDKTNANYDFFYRQDVIKPALVGLAGPWISGGVEFNWPQHHRPGTFLPADVFIEEEADGARTVWHSEHDPLNRLKGMHGFRLRPGSSLIEMRVRLFNRTPLTQTFLWWANIAARVHDQYQSFFPPDVHYVADHAVRAQSSFPIANNPYYGVRYQDRPGANDLSWYKNIPVPTSYMVCETAHEFFGGYDYAAKGGFIHVANRHIAPGKKQWTWGNHAFGHAWDRELTDTGGPYIELMAGAFTDNQPDFSYLAPSETKTFSQFFWPIQQTGPVQASNERAALRLVVGEERRIDLGVLVSAPLEGARLILSERGRPLLDVRADLKPGQPFRRDDLRLSGDQAEGLTLQLFDAQSAEVVAYQPVTIDTTARHRTVATEPPEPAVATPDELFFIGEHLEQYRHPTRHPETYWNEMLRRDPGDARAHLGLGRRLLRSGQLAPAATHLEKSIARLTSRHPNPVTGEAHYHLGLVRRWQDNFTAAYDLFYKAVWTYEWRAAAYYELAMLDCRRGNFASALAHLELSLDTNRQNNKAHVLKAAALRHLGRAAEARAVLATLLAIDPLDHWARTEEAAHLGDFTTALTLSRNDAQTAFDIAFDYADAGLHPEAIAVLEGHAAHPVTPAAVPNPLGRTQSVAYALAWLDAHRGATASTVGTRLAAARAQSPDYFFPSRLHEGFLLEWAVAQPGADPLALYALGNYFFDLKRHVDAIAAWEKSLAAGARFPTVHRNLGIGYWNIRHDGVRARAAYQQALALDPNDARLVSEFDQLCKKLNETPAARLAFLEAHRALVAQRDDATVELATLYNLLDRPADALAVLTARRFHPWEGGEGSVLRQYTTARLRLGQQALAAGNGQIAHDHFAGAMDAPENLGEAYHLLQAKADVNYWIGRALRALGREADAVEAFEASAAESGDFAEMAVTTHSALSYYRGLSLRELGRGAEAKIFYTDLREFANSRLGQKASIDYFATSLPNILVFEEDLQARRDADTQLLLALAAHGAGDPSSARIALQKTLGFSCADQRAVDLMRELSLDLAAPRPKTPRNVLV